jgi:ribA/ribD-fused uncharacterized protein
MKEHVWTTHTIPGDIVGDDYWICLPCGASGGPVVPWNPKPPTFEPFYADGTQTKLSQDCDEAAQQVREHLRVKEEQRQAMIEASKVGPVLFYGPSRPYAEFSNWHPAPFELDGKRWPTSEHYFMAMKTTDGEQQDRIRKARGPREAKRLAGPTGIITLRADWDYIKFDVMVRACYAKFSQNEDLKQLLLSTGDRPIHEDCPDKWWGGGPNYPNGKDLLGKVLMKVRQMLREESP